MSNIIIPGRMDKYDRKREKKKFFQKLAEPLSKAVQNSFSEDEMRNVTAYEVRRRVNIAKETAKKLVYDFGWGFIKIRDNINDIVDKLVHGIDVDLEEYDDQGLWTPS